MSTPLTVYEMAVRSATDCAINAQNAMDEAKTLRDAAWNERMNDEPDEKAEHRHLLDAAELDGFRDGHIALGNLWAALALATKPTDTTRNT